MYVDVNPAKPENARKGWFIRAKNSLKSLDIPRDLHDRVIERLEETRPHARTMVLFAAEDMLERYDLQVELPVVDLAHGRVEVRWGEPYVAPLLYALDEYERSGVLLIAREDWRFYEIFLGEMEEATETFRAVAPDEWRELRRGMEDLYGNLLRDRLPTHPDRFPRRLESWLHRLMRRLAHLLEEVMIQRDISRLVLMGPEEETHFFELYLTRNIRRRVVGHVGDITSHDTPVSELLDRVAPVLEAAERVQEMDLIRRIEEEPGIWGLQPTLEALQMGRLSVLVAPWTLEERVWRCPQGWVANTKDAAYVYCPGERLEEIPLRDVIVELAADFGARLEFVRGEAERHLMDSMGGLAGLTRW
jgi:hypothetical protein